MAQILESHVEIPVEPHGDIVLHLSVRLTPNPFRSAWVTIRLLSRILTPPLNLVRLSVTMPFAGIGPGLYFMVFDCSRWSSTPPRCCRSLGERAILCRYLPPTILSFRHHQSFYSLQLLCLTNSCQLGIMRPYLSDTQNCQTHWLRER